MFSNQLCNQHNYSIYRFNCVQVHHSVTVNPWRSAAAETPLASIKPMTMQPRSVVVLPTSQTSSTSSQRYD